MLKKLEMSGAELSLMRGHWRRNPGIPAGVSRHLFNRRVGSRGCGRAVSRAKREPPLLRA